MFQWCMLATILTYCRLSWLTFLFFVETKFSLCILGLDLFIIRIKILIKKIYEVLNIYRIAYFHRVFRLRFNVITSVPSFGVDLLQNSGESSTWSTFERSRKMFALIPFVQDVQRLFPFHRLHNLRINI